MACTPKLESEIQVLNPDGTVNYPVSQDGVLTWRWIFPNSTIKYRVRTLPNGTDYGKDEANFQIWCNNKEYLLQETDRTFARANKETQDIYLQEIIDVSSGKIETPELLSKDTLENLNMDRLATLVSSKNFNTNDEGFYEGSYKIPSKATVGQYAFIVSYGYDADSRQSHNERQKKLIKQIVLTTLTILAILAIAILCIQIVAALAIAATSGSLAVGFGTAFGGASVVGSIATALGASGAVAVVAGVGAFTAEYIFFEWLDKEHDNWGQFMLFLNGITDYPSTGKNKAGCEFKSLDGELGPLVHTYGGVVRPQMNFNDDGGADPPSMLSDNMKSALVVLGAVATASLLIGGKSNG